MASHGRVNALWEHDEAALGGAPWLIGVDEAGRGALAGPVVAAAALVRRELFAAPDGAARCGRVNDSKQLTAEAREGHFALIEGLRDDGFVDRAAASASVGEIEERNIVGATELAMTRALRELEGRLGGRRLRRSAEAGPLFEGDASAPRVLVDGRALPRLPFVHEGLVDGDARSLAIAMASVVAKVTRDRALVELGERYPDYGFARHKGYGTAAHRECLRRRGASAVHRPRFLRKLGPLPEPGR